MANLSRGLLYYTCNSHDDVIEQAVRHQISACVRTEHKLVAVSLNKEIEFGGNEIILYGKRSPEMMHRQILAGLTLINTDIVFMCENDVLYHPSHFNFIPPTRDIFYYNTNVWKVRYPDGFAVWTNDLQQVSGICAYRDLLLSFYQRRVKEIESGKFDGHYEPSPRDNWQSEYPNLDIRHNNNLTRTKWSPDQFRNPKYAEGWKEAYEIPGWGFTENVLSEMKNNG